MSEDDEPIFIRLVKSKIIGRAKSYVDYKQFNSAGEISEELKRAHDPHGNFFELKIELSQLLRKEGETVSEFRLRVPVILNKMLELSKGDFGEQSVKAVREATIKNAITSLLKGLKSDYTNYILEKNFDDMNKAIDTAMKVEKTIKERKLLHAIRNENHRVCTINTQWMWGNWAHCGEQGMLDEEL